MASSLPLILLPPSEGKALGGTGAPWSAGAMAIDLDGERRRVITALTGAMRGGEPARAKLLGVTGSTLTAATTDDRRVTRSPTLPAIERYTGVLYDALDHRSLPAAQRKRLDASVVIVSGLWGAVMPADPVPAYRLKMSAAPPKLGKLSSFWRDPLTEALTGRRAAARSGTCCPRNTTRRGRRIASSSSSGSSTGTPTGRSSRSRTTTSP
jgi:uncharacterized protein